MIFSVEVIDSVTFIRLTPQRATAEIAREFKDFLFDLIENQNTTHIVLDLHSVHFMDSFFLGSIVSSLKKSRLAGGDVRLLNMQPSLLPIFKLMHLDEVFTIFSTESEARESFFVV